MYAVMGTYTRHHSQWNVNAGVQNVVGGAKRHRLVCEQLASQLFFMHYSFSIDYR